MTSNETHLTVAIANLISCEGLYFNISQTPGFKKVLDLELNVSKCYKPQNRKLISKDILDIIHDQSMEGNLSLIKKGSDIFGFLFLGDGANISRIPLLNILVSGKIFQYILELVDCQGNLVDGGEKDGTVLCTIFTEHIKKDPHKSIIILVMFDGASNIQLGGELLKINCPNISVMRGVKHIVSLFFNNFSKISVLNQTITAHNSVYNLFGSDIYHKPHSILKSK